MYELWQVSDFNIDIHIHLNGNKTSEISNLSLPISDSLYLISTQIIYIMNSFETQVYSNHNSNVNDQPNW